MVVVYGRLNDPVAYDEELTLSDRELKEKARENLDITNFDESDFDFEVLETEDGEVRYVMLFTLIKGVGETAADAENDIRERFTNNAQPDDYEPAMEIGKIGYYDHLIDSWTVEGGFSTPVAHEI